MAGNIIGKVVVATASIASVVIAAVFAKAAKESESTAREQITEEVEANRDAEAVALNDAYTQISDTVTAMNRRESNKFDERRKQYMKTIGYSDTVRSLNEAAARKVDDFKRATDYDAKKRAEQLAENAEIQEWLDDENYEETVKELKGAIKDAEKKFQETVKVVNTSQIDPDNASKVRVAAEEARSKAVKEATEKLEALDKKKKKRITEIRAAHKTEIDALDRSVKEVSESCRKETAVAIEELNRKLSAEESRIRDELRGERSEEEVEAVDQLDIYKQKITACRYNESVAVNDRLAEMSGVEKMAMHLKSKNVSNTDVAFLAIIPLIPIAYCLWFYGSYILKLMAALA